MLWDHLYLIHCFVQLPVAWADEDLPAGQIFPAFYHFLQLLVAFPYLFLIFWNFWNSSPCLAFKWFTKLVVLKVFVVASPLPTNSSQALHFAYLIPSAITKNCQTGDCHTGFSLDLCTPAAELASRVGNSVAIDSVELYSDDNSRDESSEESIQRRKLHNVQ